MPKKSSEKNEKKPAKAKISGDEFEKKVKEMAQEGLTSEKIGEKLRQQGIHPREYGKKISRLMGEMYSSPDMANIQNKLDKISRHLEKNRQDKRAMREKDRIFAQLRKLREYSAKAK
jgi:ribosomal protein S15P/S13E